MSRGASNVNPLQECFGGHLNKIEEALARELNLYSWSEFYAPLKYACEGGKRIRPLILLLSAESVGRCDQQAYLAASAIELLHTESIIHDDILDEESERRGREPFHVKYGYNMSILTADFVLGIILNIAAKLKEPRVANELANVALKMSEGEMLEVRLHTEPSIELDEYINVLTHKTASIFEASAKIGAIIGGGGEDQVRALTNFGRFIGIAYQIHDDLADWKNEDRLFNALLNNNSRSKEFMEKMRRLLLDYADKARKELYAVRNGKSKLTLDDLLGVTMTE
ncbi:MAG: polyprenyl synthetase family protein [Nitrososphaerales archaeon]